MSKKKLRISIVQETMTIDEIRDLKYTQTSLTRLLDVPKLELIEWLARRKLIKNNSICNECQNEMRLTCTKNLKIKYIWTCKRPCRNTKSIFTDSIFSESRIGPDKLILFFICGQYSLHRNKLA